MKQNPPPWNPGDVLIRKGLRRVVVSMGRETCTWHFAGEVRHLVTYWSDMVETGWKKEEIDLGGEK